MLTLTKLCLLLLVQVLPAFEKSIDCTNSLSQAEKSQLLTKVESSYQDISAVTANFAQRSYFAGLDSTQESEGIVRFKKPGKMDWLYNEPDAQRFITDGKTLWYFQKADNQVTIGDFEASFRSDLPVSFLLGVGQIRSSFKLIDACSTAAGIKLQLSPIAEDPSLQNFSLLVRNSDYVPIGASIRDIGGSETTILFAEVLTNSEMQDAYFRFEIPKGVDIIDRREAH